jgi:hypothetical protein
MDTVQVVKEVIQLVWSMHSDGEFVIHVMKQAEGLVGHPLQSHLFKVLHEEVDNSRRQWQNYTRVVTLLTEISIETGKGRS